HFRVLYCRKQINETYFQKVDDKACYSSTKPNVTLFQQCNEVMCPPEWRPLPWSEKKQLFGRPKFKKCFGDKFSKFKICSATCGGGVMTRKLECIRMNEVGHVIRAGHSFCRYAAKPLTATVCNEDKHCDPPPEVQVACFIGADNIKEVLGDFTKQINWDDTNEVVKKCAKLAHNKGYTLFALGSNGLCLSEANMKQKYHVSGSEGAKCKDGIGMWNSMFVYSLGKV
ncbi:unnamed protein product, partial [Porites evermanni]